MNPLGGLPHHLPDMSDATRARVAQRLWGDPAPFLLTDEDSPSDEEASSVKRKKHSIKSGKLHTRDTHVIHHVKWQHEMVFCSQGQALVYEDIPWHSSLTDIWLLWQRKWPL